jgi:DNA-binding GntR family transcriptional regulator
MLALRDHASRAVNQLLEGLPHDHLADAQLPSLLEAQALEWAIPEMKEPDRKAAERILDELDRAQSADDIISLDGRFDETLYAPARRERTLSIIATLRFRFERYFRFAWEEETSHLAGKNAQSMEVGLHHNSIDQR